jgi:hypothetical protein
MERVMKSKIWVSILIGLIVCLAIFGKGWSSDNNSVKAQTVPTIPQYTPPADGKPSPTEAASGPSCIYGKIAPPAKLDLIVPLRKDNRLVWGNVVNPIDSACSEAIEMVCVIPVEQLPARSQLFYHREGLLTRQYVKGKMDNTPSCAEKEVSYILKKAERAQYDADKTRINIFWYNQETKVWEACSDTTLDKEVKPYGRLYCPTTQWGYFALGWPAAPAK